MDPTRLLWIGGTGTVVTALCCFTPVLVWALWAVGLTAWVAWLDWVLLPLLACFLLLTGVALWLRQRRT